MGVPMIGRCIRQFIVWLLALVIILCAFYGIIQMKAVSKEGFSKPFVINLKGQCPSPTTANAAYFDYEIKDANLK